MSRPPLDSVRLDVWLDVSCLFPTRSQAKDACQGGRVEVNGARGKPHREIRVGDRLTLTRSAGARRDLVVKALADRSISKAQARMLYEDVTPPPSREIIEARRIDRMLAPKVETPGRPDKRERRERRKQKGW